MAGQTKKPAQTPRAKARGATKKASGRAAATKPRQSRQPAKQTRSRTPTPRTAPAKAASKRATKPKPAESTAAAVERVLDGLTITPKKAVAAATVRQLAKALDEAKPGDVAKVSRELAARIAELLVEVEPDAAADKDWTEGSGPAPVRDAAQPGSADSRPRGR